MANTSSRKKPDRMAAWVDKLVEREYQKWLKGPQIDGWLTVAKRCALLERARLRRVVRHFRKPRADFGSENYGYNKAVKHILQALKERP